MRLKPQYFNNQTAEEIDIEASLSVSSSSEDSAFNVVSTATYTFTPDPIKQNEAWNIKKAECIKNGIDENEIENAKKNFYLLDAKRYYKPNSYIFKVETIGVYTNREIVKRACIYLIEELEKLLVESNTSSITINDGDTVNISYDIELKNDNYTFGKLIEDVLYSLYYTNNKDNIQDNSLSFVGYCKTHPHDDNAIIRVIFHDDTKLKSDIYPLLSIAIQKNIDIFKTIMGNI